MSEPRTPVLRSDGATRAIGIVAQPADQWGRVHDVVAEYTALE